MGVETHKASLPAPTDSSTVQTSIEGGTDVDFATDVSRRTDKTSFTIPEDGREITIPAKRRREKREREHESRITKSDHQSQTSLLIEYFEGGKGPNVQSRPSVRVKVTPSAARKIKDTNEHITVSESKGGRKPSYTRRISLGPHSPGERQITESADDRSISSYTSAAEDSSLAHRYPPVEIEVMHRDQDSDLSRTSQLQDDRLIQQNPSEISSMPPDSMLEENQSSVTPRNRSRSTSREATVTPTDTLKAPARTRSRSLSKERIAHKAMEKIAEKSRDGSSSRHRRSSKSSRSRSVSNEHTDTLRTPRRRSSKQYYEEVPTSAAESSILTNSQLSTQRQSGDQYSFKSGTSKSSINANPRLLETVENAIRRLIMPELENLKQEQKMQKGRQKFEQDSIASSGSASRGELSRKLSKHSSAPDVSTKPKVVLNRDETHAGTVLSGDSVKGRKEHRRSRQADSPRERRSEREMSEETVIYDGGSASKKRSKEGYRLKDAASGGIASGILTAAALSHHDMKHSDSRDSVDRKQRRRRRSKSHSRSASLVESHEDVVERDNIPPMPMQSDIHSSDVTRDSILSDDTERTKSPSFEVQKATVRQLARASPREVSSQGSKTPAKVHTNLHRSLGTHHSNRSQGDVSHQSPRSDRSIREEELHSAGAKASLFGGSPSIAGAGALATHDPAERHYTDYAYAHESRGLSPIQSVSSRQESEADRDSYSRKPSSMSLNGQERRQSAASGKSETSVASAAFDRSNRPKGIHLEPGEDVLDQHRLRESEIIEGEYSDRDNGVDEWLQREHEKNDQYRSSIGEDSYRDSTIDYKRMTNYTDDSMEAPDLDRVTEGQIHQQVEARKNPDYRGTPVVVESAVASLLDTSILSARSKQGETSFIDSPDNEEAMEQTYSASRKVRSEERLQEAHEDKPTLDTSHDREQHSVKSSPRQSVAPSVDEAPEHIAMGATFVPVADDPIPEIGHGLHSDSDISTNPSEIQGPMAATPSGNRDLWPYQPTPPQTKGDFVSHSKGSSAHDSLKAAAAGFLTAAAIATHGTDSQEGQVQSREWSIKDDYQPRLEDDFTAKDDLGTTRDSYMSVQGVPSPPKDEGYASGPQRGLQSPELAFKDAKSFNDDTLDGDDDPFVSQGHNRHLSTNSGLARGMGSPLYDGATGNGIDRIQSKDIVALMDHLTVRDAQRNARDTEILITLVRSAAEMRNSFEEMKKFIAEQDDILVEAGNKQHDRTVQKIIINGPRPQPNGAPRFPRRASAEDDGDDTPAKRRNVFRRALKGLSSRNQNDISKIEDMLEHLLGEVEGLKAGQEVRPPTANIRTESLDSYHNMRATVPNGYESQAQAGSSSGGQSGGYFSNPPSRGPSAMRAMDTRHGSQNRVSTVLEADEELEDDEEGVLGDQSGNNEQLLTPTKEHPRAGSVPLATPPQVQLATAAKSNENTPKTSTDKSRKHKSSSSSIFPKVSRWSKTTASSFGENFRNSTRKERPFSEASRSGELQQYEANDHYDPTGEDRLRSNVSLENDHSSPEKRPSSPLIPSQLSEDPKYQAHRDSLNLQHPQPRPGPTHRYQHQLESQAQNFGSRSPISPTSDTFGSDPTLSRFLPGTGNRYSGGGRLSPISDTGYSETSAAEQAAAPPRPPKVKDDGPLIPYTSSGPSRPPKLATKDNRPTFASPLSQEHLGPEQRWSNGSAADEAKGSPRSTSSTVPQRKPTGPRPITTSGSYSPGKDAIRRARYKGSPSSRNVRSNEDVTF
ncbi:MAG: hypothetical protein Q9217_002578 [Psora testacea]